MKSFPINYDGIFEIANVGVYRTTPDGKIVYVNPFLVKLLGYENIEELKKRNLENSSYYHPEYERNKFKEEIEKKGYFIGTSAWKTKDGRNVYVMEYAIKVIDNKGNVYYDGIVEDITELMESYQREKRLKEEWFKLFNSVPESIIILSENQTILDANETTMKLLGKDKSEIVGKKCYQLFHNTSMPPEGCPFIELMKRGGNFQLNEMTMETLDGRYLVTVAPYILPGESKRKFMHFAKDVTIIYKVQEKLINHLKQHNQILNIINDIQRVLFREKNEEDIVNMVCNKLARWEKLKGSCLLLKKGEDLKLIASHNCKVEEEIKELLLKWNGQKSIGVGDDNPLIFPLKINSKIIGFFVVAVREDISKEEYGLLSSIAREIAFSINAVRLEKEKIVAYNELERTMRELMEMVDGIRNPLAVIQGIAEIEVNEDTRKKILKEVEKITEVMRRIDKIYMREEMLKKFLSER